jgi:hypothetical protein
MPLSHWTKFILPAAFATGFLGLPARATMPDDLLRDAATPYQEARERARFLKSAGADGKLNETEASAASRQDDGFVRPFDTWTNMVRFDSDGDGQLSWAEADGYRRAVHSAMIKAYDANKDGVVDAAERAIAARKSIAGRRSGAGAGATVNGRPIEGDSVEEYKTPRGTLRVQKRANFGSFSSDPDADGDGTVTDEERRNHEASHQKFLKEFDANDDGQVDPAEWRAGQERLRRMHVGVDYDGDGTIDDAERARFEQDVKDGRAIRVGVTESVETTADDTNPRQRRSTSRKVEQGFRIDLATGKIERIESPPSEPARPTKTASPSPSQDLSQKQKSATD